MKKVFGLLAIVSMVAFVSCKSSTPVAEEVVVDEAAVVEETVAPTPAADSTTAPVEETPAQ